MSMPKRPMSKLTLVSALTSSSQALQPPAETERSLSERPKRWCSACGHLHRVEVGPSAAQHQAGASVLASRTSFAERQSGTGADRRAVAAQHAAPQVDAHGIQRDRHGVGQTATQAWQPVSQASGRSPACRESRPAGPARVRECLFTLGARTAMDLNMAMALQVVAAVREIKALVADREVRDLVVAHRQARPNQLAATGPAPCSAAARRRRPVSSTCTTGPRKPSCTVTHSVSGASGPASAVAARLIGAGRLQQALHPAQRFVDLAHAQLHAGPAVATGLGQHATGGGVQRPGRHGAVSMATPLARAARPTRPRSCAA
jgi:hypothetical protein